MGRPRRHVFVCVNERPTGGKPSCAARGGRELLEALQHAVAARPELWGEVAVTGCACLGPCFQGPNLVVYPDATWYAGATAADAPELVDSHLVANTPVARLVYDDSDDE